MLILEYLAHGQVITFLQASVWIATLASLLLNKSRFGILLTVNGMLMLSVHLHQLTLSPLALL